MVSRMQKGTSEPGAGGYGEDALDEIFDAGCKAAAGGADPAASGCGGGMPGREWSGGLPSYDPGGYGPSGKDDPGRGLREPGKGDRKSLFWKAGVDTEQDCGSGKKGICERMQEPGKESGGKDRVPVFPG